jgi:hypothetical protein
MCIKGVARFQSNWSFPTSHFGKFSGGGRRRQARRARTEGWVPGKFVGTGQDEYLHTLRHVSIFCVLAIMTLRSVVALRCVEGKFFFSIVVVGLILVSISISIFEMSVLSDGTRRLALPTLRARAVVLPRAN